MLSSLPVIARRSIRQKVAPVDYWRNEKIVYARRDSGIGIKTVVRVAKDPVLPFSSKNKSSKNRRRLKSEDRDNSARSRRREKSPSENEEDGVDDMTDPDGIVWSWEGEAEITRREFYLCHLLLVYPRFILCRSAFLLPFERLS